MSTGALHGIRAVEMAGIGPAPWAAMVLADMGADVIRIDNPETVAMVDPATDVLNRSRRSVAISAREPAGVDTILRLVDEADVLIEGFRPGAMERLGLGPDVCLSRNERLVYGRMTGWGQDGCLATIAGHDINYLAVGGVLASIARVGNPPNPPLNLVGDFGGGGMLLVVGLLAALVERSTSGRGQVVDAAMIDGAALLMAQVYAMAAQGLWSSEPGTNFIDSGAPFYDVHRTADGKYMAIGALEPRFWRIAVDILGIDVSDIPDHWDKSKWAELRERVAGAFMTRTREEWTQRFAGTDACVVPVLTMDEARVHPHNAGRGTFVVYEDVVQPAPAPRFDRTPSRIRAKPPLPGEHTDEVLATHGFAADEIAHLRALGVIA